MLYLLLGSLFSEALQICTDVYSVIKHDISRRVIVYLPTQSGVDSFSETLQNSGTKIPFTQFHGGLETVDKVSNSGSWMKNTLSSAVFIVATSAFALGKYIVFIL